MGDCLTKISLPVELYRPILREITTRRDLCSLARTSRILQSEAELMIYHHVSAETIDEIIKFCRTIRRAPRLARYTSSLGLSFFDGQFRSRGSVIWAAVYNIISDTLKLLTKLRHLDIRIPSEINGIVGGSCSRILDGCTFKLHKLTSMFRVDSKMISFLQAQTEIHELYLTSLNAPLPSGILPNLTTLSVPQLTQVSAETIAARYIRHLHVRWTHLDASFDLGLSSSSITALKTNFYSRNFSKLPPSLPHTLPQLEVLSGNIGLNNDADDQILQTLSYFTRLHSLDTFVDFSSDFEGPLLADLLYRLHEACPSLRKVMLRCLDENILSKWGNNGWFQHKDRPSVDLWDEAVCALSL